MNSTMGSPTLKRRIILIDFLRTGTVLEHEFEFSGIRFQFISHRIGWDFETAEAIIRANDGFADGFAISGIQKRVSIGKSPIQHPGYLKLLRWADKTPIYLADDIRDLFAEWTIQRVAQSEPHLLSGRKLLLQCAAVTPAIDKLEQAGARIQGADALIFTAVPKLLEGRHELEKFISLISPVIRSMPIGRLKPQEKILQPYRLRALERWIGDSDGLVTFGSLLDRTLSEGVLSALEGKLLIVDYLDPATRSKLVAAKVGQILELVPEIPGLAEVPLRQFCVITAVLDQCRLAEKSALEFNEYVLKTIQEKSVKPNATRSAGHRNRPVRCAFIIHALSDRDFFRVPGLHLFKNGPESVKKSIVATGARLPAFHYGTIRGSTSKATGQEVLCDIYCLPATPRQIMAMPEDYLYDRLIQYTKAAQKRGAAIAGLGAYTKVAGDAGVTVAKYSPIPVTNGNSYSASTTLWAARVMMDKIGITSLDPRNRGERRRAKAMVIGATGSIGRVSSLLVSLVVDELVLVAQRADKLLELREEIQKMNPRITVRVTTQPNTELPSTDLIVTATSNTRGSVLDISKVKPGAVICDCSRPLDISAAEAASRPDVMVIQSGEVELPGSVQISCDIGLPKPTVYACLAETILLAMDGRFESFSLSKTLSMRKVKEIYRIGVKHGAELSAIQGHEGVVTEEQIRRCRELALTALAGRPTDRRDRGRDFVPISPIEGGDHLASGLILPFSSDIVDHSMPEA
jgi:predicted amino acid dehydrogenase